MISAFEFRLNRPGLEDALFLIERDALPTNGDLESGFLDGIESLKKHRTRRFTDALAQSVRETATSVLVVIRNPRLVLDSGLPGRLSDAISALPEPTDWSLAGAGGLGLEDRRHLALYASANPAIPVPDGPHPLIDVMPDLYLLNTGYIRDVLSEYGGIPDTAPELFLTVTGYLGDRFAVHLDELSAGIDGDLLARDLTRMTSSMNDVLGAQLPGQTIETLSGPITLSIPPSTSIETHPSLEDCILSVVARSCRLPSLSIVTRTRFERPHLLRRLLMTISRSRSDRIEMEIVLSSDVEVQFANDQFSMLVEDFPNLHLRLCHNRASGPSRVNNLLRGFQACRNDYIACIDDDDYLDIFAFDSIAPAFFLGKRPVVIMSSAVHNERWEIPDPEHATLAHSTVENEFPASRWRTVFSGVNSLPICAALVPRAFLFSCLENFEPEHDLSEDFALFLHLFLSPGLPSVFESKRLFAHISLRDSENSVTMEDRRPWVRDIVGHLRQLTGDPRNAAPGKWALLCGLANSGSSAVIDRSVQDLRKTLEVRESHVRSLNRENDHLRSMLIETEGSAA